MAHTYYGSEYWSVVLRAERRLMVSENRVLRKITCALEAEGKRGMGKTV
jgi:hypothetical protein